MRVSFRAKLLVIVGAAAVAMLSVMFVSSWTSSLVRGELETIEEQYLPVLELGPKLENELEHMRRGFQDAVAAQDVEALEKTQMSRDQFLDRLDNAGSAIPAKEAAELRRVVLDWYDHAFSVSRRLIAGETGEALIEAMHAMQSKQRQSILQLSSATRFDRQQLHAAFERTRETQQFANQVRMAISAIGTAFVLLLSLWISRRVLRSLEGLQVGFERFGSGNFQEPIAVLSGDELGEVAKHANRMAEKLQQLSHQRDETDWVKSGQTALGRELQGELTVEAVAQRAISFFAEYTRAPVGAMYIVEGGYLQLTGSHALPSGTAERRFAFGEGLVGQAALQQELRVLVDIPPNYLRVRSGLGETDPRALLLMPVLHLDKVTALVELALLEPPTPSMLELLRSVQTMVAIALDVARASHARKSLLEETQRLADVLRAREDELRRANEELQSQQEELRQTNDELTRRARELEAQRRVLEQQNQALEKARAELQEKAKELAAVSLYKSQFLANMSHELRTPLNSMLLLSNMLAENDRGNLSDKQVEFARTINSAGQELLALINQLLDLAKIESGKQQARLERTEVSEISEHLRAVHGPVARNKGLELTFQTRPGTAAAIHTDRQRVEQILRNLIGNAIKFTEKGGIEVAFGPGKRRLPNYPDLPEDRIWTITVTDTGIGIPTLHQERIFAPFEQLDSTTERRYGGTGLGLAIVRELIQLLGGELELQSEPGKGSTFTISLPDRASEAGGSEEKPNERAPAPARAPAAKKSPTPVAMTSGDLERAADRASAAKRRRESPSLLIVEDDPAFAELVAEIASARGLSVLIAPNGETGIKLARAHHPSGIVLDVRLPDIDGFSVMERLRSSPETRDIPVHFVSCVEGADQALALGALGYLTKPVTREEVSRAIEMVAPASKRPRRVLVVEDDAALGNSVVEMLGAQKLEASRVGSATQALEELRKGGFGCMILDLGLPDMDGLELLEQLEKDPAIDPPPVVIYTGRALSKSEARRLENYAEAIVLKEGASKQRLLEETRLFLDLVDDAARSRSRAVTLGRQARDVKLEGKKILVADDDMRAVYALSALLRGKGADVVVADTGKAAIEVLNKNPDIKMVLIDIMMPEMDGYEAMRRIREIPIFSRIPIIALSAKAMKGDRQKCIEAGASDYLSKPVDGERLLSIMQAWLGTDGHG